MKYNKQAIWIEWFIKEMTLPKVCYEVIKKLWLMKQFLSNLEEKTHNFTIPRLVQDKNTSEKQKSHSLILQNMQTKQHKWK